MASLLDEIDAIADGRSHDPDRASCPIEAHNCDGCGEVRPDVDVWATNSETGEDLRLCEACAEW